MTLQELIEKLTELSSMYGSNIEVVDEYDNPVDTVEYVDGAIVVGA